MKILRTASLGSNFSGSYMKKECIAFSLSSIASSNKCSEFNFILLSVFLLKYKVCYKQIFLEYAFQIKI